MKVINKIAVIVTKILEIGHWVAAALMTAAAVCAKTAPEFVERFVGLDVKECCGVELNVYGFEINAAVADGKVDMKAVFLFGIGAVIILLLMAMVFRNLYLILRKSAGNTPFQADNVRMVREIGIFSISVSVVGFIMSIISRLVLGAESAEISSLTDGLIMGLIVLCLTQIFAYGVKLENDVDGLL